MADMNNDILKKAQHLISTFQEGLDKGYKLYSTSLNKELKTVIEIIDALEVMKDPAEIMIFENEKEFQKFLANKN